MTDPSAARRHQKRLSRLSNDVEPHGIPGVKAAAKAAGLEPGYPRAPAALTAWMPAIRNDISSLSTLWYLPS